MVQNRLLSHMRNGEKAKSTLSLQKNFYPKYQDTVRYKVLTEASVQQLDLFQNRCVWISLKTPVLT